MIGMVAYSLFKLCKLNFNEAHSAAVASGVMAGRKMLTLEYRCRMREVRAARPILELSSVESHSVAA